MNAPCYNCLNRYTLCHEECEKYKEFKSIREEISIARVRNNAVADYFVKTSIRAAKARKAHA